MVPAERPYKTTGLQSLDLNARGPHSEFSPQNTCQLTAHVIGTSNGMTRVKCSLTELNVVNAGSRLAAQRRFGQAMVLPTKCSWGHAHKGGRAQIEPKQTNEQLATVLVFEYF